MADKRTRLKEKKQARQKKQREKARKSRASRAPAPTTDNGLRNAHRWPVSECYLSANWYEQGANLHAVFSRAQEVGPAAVAQFEIDLEKRGIISCRVGVVQDIDQVRGLCVELSEPHAMLDTSPSQVVKVVLEAAAFGAESGHPTPKGYAEAIRLFEGVDPDLAPHGVHVGVPAPEAEKKASLFSRLFGAK
ncbi:MAG: hypothetical protein ACI9MC_000686 [Kiritimatiellia bacterium]|jgi:hypothetical protein